MLYLTRRVGQKLVIDLSDVLDEKCTVNPIIEILVVPPDFPKQTKLGVDADHRIYIDREEIYLSKKNEALGITR